MNILLTGGTGTFGREFVRQVAATTDFIEIESVSIYSRDEMKQSEMRAEFGGDDRFRWILGDVRDGPRLLQIAMRDEINYIVHAAALKQVPAGEEHPSEFVKTNVLGALNVVAAAEEIGARVVALSSDKAVSPINLYGASKLCSDKIFLAAGHVVVRYGNVSGSRGSVIPLWRRQAISGVISITDRRMTRFWLEVSEAARLVFAAMERGLPGEVWIPKMPAYRVEDLARAVAPECEVMVTGIRIGEKLHEVMIGADNRWPHDMGDAYVISPYDDRSDGELCPDRFRYDSETTPQRLGVEELTTRLEGIS